MKRYICILLSLFFFVVPVVNADEFKISGENVILYNLNDYSVIYEKNADEKTAIASLTKIMTAVVAIENVDNLNKVVTLTKDDFKGIDGYAEAGFKVGDKVTYLDLLYGILLPSGAEAVNAMVNNTLGYDEFISKMNDKAKEIGMNDTSFSNAIGKDSKNNYSTAKDVATLLNYALKNDTFKKVYTTKTYIATNGLKLQSTLNSYKNFLNIEEINGAKSGFTQKAGRCLASIATLNDVDYLLVVINSSSAKAYNAVLDTLTIYDYYNENYSYQVILDDNEVIKEIPIKWSKEKSYNITSSEDVKLFLENDFLQDLKYEYEGINEIKYNTKKGEKLGIVKIYNNDELLHTLDVYLNEDILYYHLWLWGLFIVWLLVIIYAFVFVMIKKRKRKLKTV